MRRPTVFVIAWIMFFSSHSARYAFQAVDQRRDNHLGGIVNPQVEHGALTRVFVTSLMPLPHVNCYLLMILVDGN